MEPPSALIARVQAGDRRAFVTLVERYERLVAHVVFRLVPDARDREELCQDVFVKVHRKLGTFRGEAKLSTWIARIAYRTCLNHLEKNRLPLYDDLAATPDADDAPPATERLAAPAPPPDALLAAADVRAAVYDGLDALPPRDRVILSLYHLDGLSVQEISLVVGRPAGTVKSDLFRARKKLRDRLLGRYTMEELRR